MDLKLAGKVALITGASRGIGRTIALRLAEEGMTVALAARSEDALHRLADEITSRGGQTLVHATDLRKTTASGEFVTAVIARFGRVDLLVNNAGATKRGDFFTLTDDDWADGFALKFFGAMRLCCAAWPHLVKHNGSIVNIAGVGGRTGSADFTIGGTVNAAVLNLTKCLADRGIRDGVRVNAINPGAIATDRLKLRIAELAKSDSVTMEEAARRMAQQLGIARFGEPEEIADSVAFLASARASHLQGAILDIDGGQTRTL